MFMEAQAFHAALLCMDRLQVKKQLAEALAREGRIQAIEGLVVPAMERIGLEWEQGQLALAQVYMAGRVCEAAVDAVLFPESDGTATGPPIGLAVFQDQHQMGKRIVSSVLKSAGYQVLDYGYGLGAEELAHRALTDHVPILMVSVLMLHSAMNLKTLRSELQKSPQAPVLVAGGAPFRFDPSLGECIGLDAVGTSATDALRLARHYLGEPCLK